jgi:putative ABC transport system permease protein
VKFSEDKFFFSDANFFRFFSFKLLYGNKEQVLENPFSVVISEQAASKYFGKEDPIGQTIRYNNSYDFIITGVAASPPSNSSIEFEFIASLSSLVAMQTREGGPGMEETSFLTYFLLRNPSDVS